VKTELLQQIEGVESQGSNNLLLAATNCPWELDSAFLRRNLDKWYLLHQKKKIFTINLICSTDFRNGYSLAYPQSQSGSNFLEFNLKEFQMILLQRNFKTFRNKQKGNSSVYYSYRISQLFRQLNSFSGSDIVSIVSDTLMEPIRELERCKHFKKAWPVFLSKNTKHKTQNKPNQNQNQNQNQKEK